MGKEVLFIPGNTNQVDSYPKIVSGLEKKGYTLYPLRMDWTVEKSPSVWARQVEEQIDQHAFEVVIGHSFGSAAELIVVSKMVLQQRAPETVIFCSPSPVFEDDILQPRIRTIYENKGGIPKMFGTMSAIPMLNILSDAENVNSHLLYGEAELYEVKDRGKRSAMYLGIQPKEVPGASHFPEEYPEYVRAILSCVP